MRYIIFHPQAEALDALRIPESDGIALLTASIEKICKSGLLGTGGRAAIVAPGNSFAIMDGGIDRAFTAIYNGIQGKLQAIIANEYFGELPIGCAVSVSPLETPFPIVIYAPTMQVPMTITHTANVYYATLAALREAKRHHCDAVYFPILGAGTGQVPLEIVGYQMRAAITASMKHLCKNDITWEHAAEKHHLWHELTGIPE